MVLSSIRFIKDDTVLDMIPGWACDYIDVVYMMGELTWVYDDDSTEGDP